MRRLEVLVCVLVVLIGVPAFGFGQWLHYPTADVPRRADWKPDWTAPAPRLVAEFCLENEKSYQRMQTTRGK